MNKKQYLSPKLKVVEFRTERGFAQSIQPCSSAVRSSVDEETISSNYTPQGNEASSYATEHWSW